MALLSVCEHGYLGGGRPLLMLVGLYIMFLDLACCALHSA